MNNKFKILSIKFIVKYVGQDKKRKMADHFKNLAHSEDQSTFIMICMGRDVELAVSASI